MMVWRMALVRSPQKQVLGSNIIMDHSSIEIPYLQTVIIYDSSLQFASRVHQGSKILYPNPSPSPTLHQTLHQDPASSPISNAGVGDSGLQQLSLITSLEAINLDSTVVADGGLLHLATLSRLHSLDLSGAKVTDSGCMHLRHAFRTTLEYVN